MPVEHPPRVPRNSPSGTQYSLSGGLLDYDAEETLHTLSILRDPHFEPHPGMHLNLPLRTLAEFFTPLRMARSVSETIRPSEKAVDFVSDYTLELYKSQYPHVPLETADAWNRLHKAVLKSSFSPIELAKEALNAIPGRYFSSGLVPSHMHVKDESFAVTFTHKLLGLTEIPSEVGDYPKWLKYGLTHILWECFTSPVFTVLCEQWRKVPPALMAIAAPSFTAEHQSFMVDMALNHSDPAVLKELSRNVVLDDEMRSVAFLRSKTF